MKKDEAIKQLESIKNHCASFIDEDEPNCIWKDDVDALEFAIATIKKETNLEGGKTNV